MSLVLVVDDEPVVARLIGQLLLEGGHQTVQMTGNLKQLLNPDCAIWLGVEVLVCGLRMSVPGIDLLSVAAAYHPRIKRIVFTRLGPRDLDVNAATALAHRVLHKPEDVLRVTTVVEELTA